MRRFWLMVVVVVVVDSVVGRLPVAKIPLASSINRSLKNTSGGIGVRAFTSGAAHAKILSHFSLSVLSSHFTGTLDALSMAYRFLTRGGSWLVACGQTSNQRRKEAKDGVRGW